MTLNISTVRTALMAYLIVCGLIVTGLTAYVITTFTGSYVPQFNFAVFLGVVTVIGGAVGIALAARATPLFEIAAFSVLSIFWLSAAGSLTGTPLLCWAAVFTTGPNWCSMIQAVQAFSWLAFLGCLTWLSLMFALSMKMRNAGRLDVWRMPLAELSLQPTPVAPSAGAAGGYPQYGAGPYNNMGNGSVNSHIGGAYPQQQQQQQGGMAQVGQPQPVYQNV